MIMKRHIHLRKHNALFIVTKVINQNISMSFAYLIFEDIRYFTIYEYFSKIANAVGHSPINVFN